MMARTRLYLLPCGPALSFILETAMELPVAPLFLVVMGVVLASTDH